MPRGVTILEEADEILALVDASSRARLAKLLSRPENVSPNRLGK